MKRKDETIKITQIDMDMNSTSTGITELKNYSNNIQKTLGIDTQLSDFNNTN